LLRLWVAKMKWITWEKLCNIIFTYSFIDALQLNASVVSGSNTFSLSSGERFILRELMAKPSLSRTISTPITFMEKSRSRTYKKKNKNKKKSIIQSTSQHLTLLIDKFLTYKFPGNNNFIRFKVFDKITR